MLRPARLKMECRNSASMLPACGLPRPSPERQKTWILTLGTSIGPSGIANTCDPHPGRADLGLNGCLPARRVPHGDPRGARLPASPLAGVRRPVRVSRLVREDSGRESLAQAPDCHTVRHAGCHRGQAEELVHNRTRADYLAENH